MKNFILTFLIFSSVTSLVTAKTIDCIIVKHGEKILIQEGENCNTPYSPNSSFKIPLAVMGFESGILKTAHNPIWKPRKPVTFLKYYHDGEQSPSSWMRFSMPWYSQILTQKIGIKKFQEYINRMNYGNKDISGDKGQNNGLTDSWLSSSLKITPMQQIEFIERLAKNELQFSKESQVKAIDLTKLMEAGSWNGWNLHGKTGSSDLDKINVREGYFIGFAQKNAEIISYVIHMSGEIGDKSAQTGGLQVKKVLLDRMTKDGILND
jgi:beta-lactamase class D